MRWPPGWGPEQLPANLQELTCRNQRHPHIHLRLARITLAEVDRDFLDATAEALRQALPGALEVRSAGFHAKTGRPSPEAHVRMSQSVGVDLSAHRSSLVSADDLAWADLIVFMDRHNWARLRELQAPEAKLLWLGGLMPGDVEIPDPYGLGPEAARAVVDRLAACTAVLAGSLRKA